MATIIEVTQDVLNIEVEITQDDKSIIVQPVISRSGSSDTSDFMKKSVYDQENKEEQILTISDVIDAGEI
jgi:cephalosporin hydroxylase